MKAPGSKDLMGSFLGILTLASAKQSRLAETGEFLLLSMTSFIFPFLLSNQLMVGIAVNASLMGGALYMKGKNLIPVIILPSMGLLARGIVFGPATLYLLYMIPFIWLGNTILVFSLKLFHLRMKKAYIPSALAASVLKTALLFSTAFALYSIGMIPVEFLAAMGIMQLATAACASVAMAPIEKIRSG